MKKLEWYDLISKSHKEKYTIVYNQFLDYGRIQAPYIASKHDMTTEYCACYIASGLFQKYLQLKAKKIADFGRFYNNVDYESLCHVFALIRKVKNNLNFKSCGYYTDGYDKTITDDFYYLPKIGFTQIVKKSELIRENIGNSKQIDIVDILEQWENRDARTQAKKTRRYFEGEDGTSEIDRISSHYGTPENKLLNKCTRERARIEIDYYKNHCTNFSRILHIVTKTENRTGAERVALNDFRKRYNVYHENYETLHSYSELMAIEE
jgi:hypothetical protein